MYNLANLTYPFILRGLLSCTYNLSPIFQVPGFPQWFNIKYDDDIAIYTAKLGEDYKAGDVIIKA